VSIPPEDGRDLRARAWKYIFACHARKQAGQPEYPLPERKEVPYGPLRK
jgi:hypothetical protein